MILKQIEVRTGLRTVDQAMPRTESELDVRLKYGATSLEVSQVAAMLVPGTTQPPAEFWAALDIGEVVSPSAEPSSMVVTVTPVQPDGSRGMSKVVLMAPNQTVSVPVTWSVRGPDGQAVRYAVAVEVHATTE